LFLKLSNFSGIASHLIIVLLSYLLRSLLHVRGQADLVLKTILELLDLPLSLLNSSDFHLQVDEANDLDVGRNVVRDKSFQATFRLGVFGIENDGFTGLGKARNDGRLVFEDLEVVGSTHEDRGLGLGRHLVAGKLLTDGTDSHHQAVHLLLDIGFLKSLAHGGVGSNADGFSLVCRQVRQPLVQLLSDEGHRGVQKLKRSIEHSVQSVERSLAVTSFDGGLDSFEVHVSEVLLPEVVEAVCHVTELVVHEVMVRVGSQLVEASKDPLVRQRQLRLLEALDFGVVWLPVLGEVAKSKLDNVPQFVSELAVANHALDIKVNRTLNHVGQQSEAESIGAALGNTSCEILLPLNDVLFDFGFRQV